MASIKLLAEQAQRILAGGTPTDDFEPRIEELQLSARQQLALAIVRRFYETKKIDEAYLPGEYIISIDEVPVLEDTVKKKYYSEMEYTTMTLPFDMGIYQVGSQENQESNFVPISNGMEGLMAGLMVSCLESRIGYFRENGRLYYKNMTAENKPNYVLIKLVVSGSDRDAEDNFDIGDDIQAEVVAGVVEQYSVMRQVPNDNANDGIND